jgi:hypothetical protein
MSPLVLLVALGFAPAPGTLASEACSPTAAQGALPAGPPERWALPPMCGQEFEGACTSLDGRVRVSIRFEGKKKRKRVRSGFYGGEGWMDDTFYTGMRTLSIEDTASGRRAAFVERLRDSRGYTAPGGKLRYLPQDRLVLFLDTGMDKEPQRSYCVRLP